MPNVLIYLITIYDDEEGSEALCITPVPITQEDEPLETYAPASDVLIPNPQESDHEDRNTLDTIFPNQPGTQPQGENSKNDLDTCEQEEEIGDPEINIS
jgi:hypothetical protein